MGTDFYADSLRMELDAAFRGIGPSLDAIGRTDERFVSLVLEAFGDAIRFGIETPRPVRAWCRQLDEGQLTSALERVRAEAAAWRAPSPGSADKEPESEFDVHRRDQTESALRAIAWLCLDRGATPADLVGWKDCAETVRRFDDRLAEVLDRSAVETLLGPRVRLLGDRDWTSRMADRETEQQTTQHAQGDVTPSRRPSDAAIQQYITEGINQRFVEGHATHDADFAEDLADVIDAFKEMRQDVGIAAWRWRRSRQKQEASTRAFPLSVEPRKFARAASDGTELTRERKELGRLPGLPADATLEVDGESVTLRVFTETPLVEIRIGDAKSASPTSGGTTAIWQVSTRFQRGPIQISVTAEDGRVFADQIELTPE